MTREALLRRLRHLAITLALTLPPSICFGAVLNGEISLESARRAVLSALLIATPMLVFEYLFVNGPAGAGFRRWPFTLFVLARLAVWSGLIFAAMLIAHFTLWDGTAHTIFGPDWWWTVAFAFAISLTTVAIASVDRLLGRGVLANFVAGRYHHPREERRAVLFIDLEGSTAAAERIGPVRFMELLDRFVTDVDAAAEGSGGHIHRYVGDEVILTWRLDRDADVTAAVRTVTRLAARIGAAAPRYQADFGAVPRFRAALHAGPVVTGEIGDSKRDIVVLGDTMNTTARIEQVCRDVGKTFLASAEAMAGVRLPDTLTAVPLPPVRLRGKAEPVSLVSIEPAGAVRPLTDARRTAKKSA